MNLQTIKNRMQEKKFKNRMRKNLTYFDLIVVSLGFGNRSKKSSKLIV